MSDELDGSDQTSKQIILIISVFGLFTLALHLFTNIFTAYGIFRDELYYIACSKRPDIGYVDQPPFSIWMLYISRTLFGESLFSIRILPSLFSAFTVFLTGLTTYKIGGRIPAVILSCTAIVWAPIFLAMNSVYSMNTYDYFFWIIAVYILVLIIKSGDTNYWYYFALVAGLGLLNKIGFLWFGAGVFVGLLFTSPGIFRRKEIYIAGIIALLLFSPFVIWNITHDFAHLEFISNATKYKYSGINRMDFVLGQILLLNPVSLPLWLAGLYFFLFTEAGKRFRIVGIIYLVSFLVLLINGASKPEYLGPAYASLFSGGAVYFENLFSKQRKFITAYIFPGIISLSGIFLLPLTLPVLPVETFIKYQNAIGMEPTTMEGKRLNSLPQFYADMFGWKNMAKTVSEVYNRLTPEEKKTAVVFAGNYGEAGALEYFSSMYPLPPVVSPHNNYWYWFNEVNREIKIVIVIGGDLEDHISSCESVEAVSAIKHNYAMPYESDLPVYICRKLKKDIQVIWNESKHFI